MLMGVNSISFPNPLIRKRHSGSCFLKSALRDGEIRLKVGLIVDDASRLFWTQIGLGASFNKHTINVKHLLHLPATAYGRERRWNRC